MASTATHLPEKSESRELIASKAREVAKILRGEVTTASDPATEGGKPRLIFFTGAGISTSCGIPDFRGPKGVWTMRDKGLKPVSGVPVALASPSKAHEVVAQMVTSGIADCVVSQNTDGLHARSGVPLDKLFELHGNSYKSCCWYCDNQKMHTRPCRAAFREERKGGACKDCSKFVPYFCHCVEERCDRCGAEHMVDSIIHFKENLREREIRGAFSAARKADVCIVLGSSLTVSPANGVPETVAERGGSLVIVNKQDTPLDDVAAVRVYGDIDAFVIELAAALGMPTEVKRMSPKGSSLASVARTATSIPSGSTGAVAAVTSKLASKIGLTG